MKQILPKTIQFIRKSRKKAILTGLSIIIVLISISGLILYFPKGAKAAWFDDNWAFRKKITITVTTNSSDINNLETLITVDTTGITAKLQSACQDLRFTNQSGNILPYYFSSCSNNSATNKIWLMVDLVPKNTTTYVAYMYYGNSTASAASSSTLFDNVVSLGGYWTMNEGTASTANDSSVNTNTGTLTGTVSWVTGNFSNGISTSGSSGNYVSVNDDTTIKPTAAVTIEAWVKPTSTTNTAGSGLICKGNGAGGESYCLDLPTLNNLTPRFFVRSGGTPTVLPALTTISSGSWTHLAGVFDGTNLYIYINGLLNTSIAGPATIDSNTHILSIGCRQSGSTTYDQCFNGAMDDVKVYSSARTAAEIAADAGNTSCGGLTCTIATTAVTTSKPTTAFASEEIGTGPIAYWKFDEGQGTTAHDSTLTANNGTFTSTPTWKTEDMCAVGKCLYFDGTTEYITSANSTNFDPTKSWTVEAWIKGNTFSLDTNTRAILAQKDGTGTGRTLLDVNTNGTLNSFIGGVNTNGTTVMSTNIWYHVAAKYDSSSGNATVYTNGMPSVPTAVTPEAANGAFVIGIVKNLTNGRWNGFIDDVKIYAYARSQAQINADYASRGSGKGSGAVLGASIDNNSALSNGLVGYWKLEESSGNRIDSSGNAHTLTDKNTVTTNPGKFGNAAQFTRASSQALYAADNSDLSLSATDFTLTAWVYQDSTTAGDRCIICKADTSGNKREYILTRSSAGPWSFAVSSNGTSFDGALTSSLTPSASTWYFVVAWYDSTKQTLNLQVNDGPVESASFTGTVRDDTSEFMLGSAGTDTSPLSNFDGRIDEARVYRRALSNTERDFLYNWSAPPVGYWKMDDGSGTSATDSVNANTGTWTGTGGHWTSGQYGGGAIFNGSDDYINVPTSTNYDLIDSTWEGWFKTTQGSTTNGAWLMGRASATSTGGVYVFLDSSGVGKMRVQIKNTAGTSRLDMVGTRTGLNDGKWHHWALQIEDTTDVALFIDGVYDHDNVPSGSWTFGANPIRLGISQDSFWAAFKGSEDDIRVYNYVRSNKLIISDINAGHPIGGSPISSRYIYWPLDEGYGTGSGAVHDDGYGNFSGNLSGPTWLSPSSCKVNGCLSFANTTDNVSAGDTGELDSTGLMDLTFWINPQSLVAGREIVSKSATSNEMFRVETGSTPSELKITISTSTSDTSTFFTTSGLGLTASSWQHIAIVYDGTQGSSDRVKVYRNGLPTAGTITGTIPTVLQGTTANLKLGKSDSGVSSLSMYIDDFKVYVDLALTQSEVNIDYNSGATINFGTGASTESSLISGGAGSAPILWWKFDENTGSPAPVDSSGNSNTGTATSMSSNNWVPGKYGSGLKFDGSTQYITKTSLSTSISGDFTISLWFQAAPGTVPNTQPRMADLAQAATFGFQPSMQSTGTVGFDDTGGPGSNCFSTATYNDNKWHQFTGVRSGTSYNSYVDGVFNCGVTGGTAPTYTRLFIAREQTDLLRNWTGGIDNVKVFNYAMTLPQISYEYNRGTPVEWYKFDECQGSIAYNTAPTGSGNTPGNNGTITPNSGRTVGTCGSGTSTEMWNGGTTGKYNGSLAFDGAGDYVQLTTNALIDITKDFSITAWVKPTTGSTLAIYGQGNTANTTQKFEFDVKTTGALEYQVRNDADSGFNDNTISTLTSGAWTHVGITKTGSVWTFYINGIPTLAAANSTSGTYTFNRSSIGVVQRSANQDFFNGQIDDVRIYNYVLSTNQVKQVYNNGAVFFGPVTGTP